MPNAWLTVLRHFPGRGACYSVRAVTEVRQDIAAVDAVVAPMPAHLWVIPRAPANFPMRCIDSTARTLSAYACRVQRGSAAAANGSALGAHAELARDLQISIRMNDRTSENRRSPAAPEGRAPWGRLLARTMIAGASLAHGLSAAATVPAMAPGEPVSGMQSLQSIRAAAEKFVRAEMPGDSKGIFVNAADLDSRLRLAHCAAPLRAAMVSGGAMQARVSIGVSCREGAQWTIYVPVSVESEIPVLVLRKPVVRGQRITGDDVAQETRRVSGFAVGYVGEVRALDRHTASRPLPVGAVLTTDSLLADFIVKSGESVTLVAATGGIEVRASGRAMSDGREGARIRVQNLNSLKIVEGVVDSDRVIHVTP